MKYFKFEVGVSMSSAMVRNQIGRPVQGDDFFDRVAEQRRIWRDLETDHLLLLAPRRVGKTSLMWRLRDTSESHGFAAVYMTAEGVKSEADFVRKLYRSVCEVQKEGLFERLQSSLAERFSGRISIAAGPVSLELKEAIAQDWERSAEALETALGRSGEPWLLMVDELPVFLLHLLQKDEERARHFLHWFRALRNQADGVRWLLAGSIGLDTVTELHNLTGTINDLSIAKLGPFSSETALAFFQALERRYKLGLDTDTAHYIVERVGWPIPYFLHLIYREVRNQRDDTGCAADKAAVDRAWKALLHHTRSSHFARWHQRLAEQLGPLRAGRADRVLTAIALPEGGAKRDTLRQLLVTEVADVQERERALAFTLSVLRNDGYVVAAQDVWMFRSPLLRDWWRCHRAS